MGYHSLFKVFTGKPRRASQLMIVSEDGTTVSQVAKEGTSIGACMRCGAMPDFSIGADEDPMLNPVRMDSLIRSGCLDDAMAELVGQCVSRLLAVMEDRRDRIRRSLDGEFAEQARDYLRAMTEYLGEARRSRSTSYGLDLDHRQWRHVVIEGMPPASQIRLLTEIHRHPLGACLDGRAYRMIRTDAEVSFKYALFEFDGDADAYAEWAGVNERSMRRTSDGKLFKMCFRTSGGELCDVIGSDGSGNLLVRPCLVSGLFPCLGKGAEASPERDGNYECVFME